MASSILSDLRSMLYKMVPKGNLFFFHSLLFGAVEDPMIAGFLQFHAA